MICLLKMWMFLSKLFNYQRVTRRNWDLETNLRADQQERKNYPEKLSYIDEYKKWIQDICCHEFWSSLAWLLSVSKNRVAHSIPCLIPYVYSLYNGPKLIYPPPFQPQKSGPTDARARYDLQQSRFTLDELGRKFFQRPRAAGHIFWPGYLIINQHMAPVWPANMEMWWKVGTQDNKTSGQKQQGQCLKSLS